MSIITIAHGRGDDMSEETKRKPIEMPKNCYPVQCDCGHIYIEKYEFGPEMKIEAGYDAFCWCGWCRKRLSLKWKHEVETI